MHRFATWLVAMVLVVSLGGHWFLLQGFAWGSMLARFAQSMPLTDAVAFTFDGKHPCQLCLAVQKGQQEERKESRLQPVQKLVLMLDAQDFALVPPPPFPLCHGGSIRLEARPEAPPRPPPRPAAHGSFMAPACALMRPDSGSRSRAMGARTLISGDRIEDLFPILGRQFTTARPWELPRCDVPTYPDCEKGVTQGKSHA